MMNLLYGKHITYSASAVARLGVPDVMGPAPTSVETLAEKVGAHAPSLYRVMRLLSSVGVFEESAGRSFRLTPAGELLKTDAPGSLRYLAILFGDEWNNRAFGQITQSVRTGESGVKAAYGRDGFELLAELGEQAENFHRAMTNLSAVVGRAIVDAYDFSAVRTLADIGGGHGKLLASVLRRYPTLQGILYDLPDVVEGASRSGCFAGCEDRVRIEGGSFFERVPAGADAYMMKAVLHDWDDDRCRQILRLVRAQLPAGGRVLVCEMVAPDDGSPSPALMLDIEMLIATQGGKERTKSEFDELFRSAGLRLTNVVATRGPVCVLEAKGE
jgi:hypothetical protein